jgi:ABC-type Na+ transport system ATPase subunit NatA
MYSGWDCAYTSGSKATEGSPSVHDTIGYLLGLSLIYLLLASYWIQIFPARNGARRSFYFFLLPSYWYSPLHDRDDDQNSSCVEIKNMSKKFGSFQAVKDFTLKLRGGEVTALLGHNGAGKSTVINILSCEMQMSAGEISVFGKSVVDQFGVRQMIGVCKQDDYLWPNLSAKEHLDIFAGLRGVDPNLHDSIVEKWLESVDLTLIKHKYSAAFSGGMKRRLSVALATIGERPLVILDEPTTGLVSIYLSAASYFYANLFSVNQLSLSHLTLLSRTQ